MTTLVEKSGKWSLVLRDKPKGKRCMVQQCRRRRPKRGRICSRCLMRRWRLNNPMRASFNWLRRSAQKRDIPFELTFAEFKTWALETGYLDKRGREIGCFHCDRIDASQGYKIGNLQLLPVAENARKDSWRRGWRLRVESTETENPF